MVTYLTTVKKHGLDYVIWEDVTDNQSIIRTYRNY